MRLFGKKKDDDEDLDEEEELEEKIHSRKFKDLKSENRRKRKEPTKPWGKKERLIVLIVLALTVLLSVFLAAQSRGFNLPHFPKMSEFKFPFGGEETIIINKK